VVLYELLTGGPPFLATEQTKLMHDQAYQKHQPLSEKTRSISKKCETIIDKMLDKDKDKRFQSWEELKKAVQQYFNLSNPQEKKGRQHKQIRMDKTGKNSIASLDKKYKNTSNIVQHRKSVSLAAIVFLVLNILLSLFLLFTVFHH
jgi:serine/threonine protein kinase